MYRDKEWVGCTLWKDRHHKASKIFEFYMSDKVILDDERYKAKLSIKEIKLCKTIEKVGMFYEKNALYN